MPIQRHAELRTRRKRRGKLSTLRKRYKAARTEEERSRVLAKVNRIHPMLSSDEFLAPLNRE
jgi:hypothetical protein